MKHVGVVVYIWRLCPFTMTGFVRTFITFGISINIYSTLYLYLFRKIPTLYHNLFHVYGIIIH